MKERDQSASCLDIKLGAKPIAILALALAACVALSSGAVAKEPSVQYANISPLPGGGIAMNPNGMPDGQGALQVNIPVAYTPRWGFASAGVFKGNHEGTVDTDNGSGILGLGFGEYPRTRIYVSGLQVSHIMSESKALNAQVLLWQEKEGTLAVSGGYQDILRKEQGQRAPYLVATKALTVKDKTIYGTLGYGGGRFLNSPFGGVSVPLGDKFNAAMEYDGWQLNTGIAWRPGGRSGKITFLGANNGHLGTVFGASAVTWFGK